MNQKFELCTFCFQNEGFLEYESEQDMQHDQCDGVMQDCTGYFPSDSNITYAELETEPDGKFTVAHIDTNGVMQLHRYKTKADLLAALPSLKFTAQNDSEEYLTVYRDADFVEKVAV